MYRHDSHRLPLLAAAVLTATLQAQGTPIGFEETWALAPDRSKAVAQLIPGTDDWYYYHCRERLDARDFSTVQQVLPAWIDNHGRTARVIEIENRHALLAYANDPGATFAFLQKRLALHFDHQRIVPGERSDLPVRLDPELLANATLTQRALARHPGSVDGFTDSALAGLLSTNLEATTLHSLLERLARPDVDNLPALIVRDLEYRGSSGFGSKPVHRLLRRAQLDECARLRPALLRERAFVDAYLGRLQPSADTDWQLDPAAMQAQLLRLWEFAQRLPPAHNSLKAHVLFHLLQHDLTQGAPDKERFRSFVRLPRRSGHPSDAHLQRHQRSNEFVDGNTQFPTGLPAIGDDTALVRACLEHFFAREDSYETYAEFLDADWLKVVLAETKILLGQGDMERWYSLLSDPAHLDRLEQRVEIGFPPTQRRQFAANEAVALAVDTKNVPLLLVKVFAIDSYRFHQEKQTDIDATIDLDGVVANFEQTFTYTEPKLRRVRRTFDLPMLREPGTYIVEFVGNGLSSRAVVHKGWLRHAEHTAAAGHVFRVYDEAGTLLKDANLWFGGREYAADAAGEILLPFSSAPGQHKVVLHHGNRSSLATFAHQGETYELHGDAHLDRESLIAGKKARLLVRPQLRLGQNDVSLQLLTQPVLTIVATDLDGLETKQEVRDVTLANERELVHEITVPERLASLRVSLSGVVRDLGGKDVTLHTSLNTFAVNGMDASPATSSVMLQHTTGGYVLEVRGKNGEVRGGQTIQLRLRHRHYRETIDVALQSDPTGRITLGALPGIDEVHIRQTSGFEGHFQLRPAMSRRPVNLHGIAGETLRLPYQGKAVAPSRAELSLLGVESDAFDNLAIVDGFLELRDLEPGDYELHLHAEQATIAVRITRGQRDGAWLVGTDRILAAATTQPLHLRAIEVTGDELLVRLANPSSSTRVHVAATRYEPAFLPFFDLYGAPATPARELLTERATSSYHAGRTLGDEYRYVLDRQQQQQL